jgi:hypothetical protein
MARRAHRGDASLGRRDRYRGRAARARSSGRASRAGWRRRGGAGDDDRGRDHGDGHGRSVAADCATRPAARARFSRCADARSACAGSSARGWARPSPATPKRRRSGSLPDLLPGAWVRHPRVDQLDQVTWATLVVRGTVRRSAWSCPPWLICAATPESTDTAMGSLRNIVRGPERVIKQVASCTTDERRRVPLVLISDA